jgi:hypothetical protein
MAETGCVCGDVFKTTTVLFAIRCTAEATRRYICVTARQTGRAGWLGETR